MKSTMKTITAPNGKQYEVEEGWEDRATMPIGQQVILLYPDGIISTWSFRTLGDKIGSECIAWRPIVAPKESRWRAEYNGVYWYVDDEGESSKSIECNDRIDERRWSIGNYFQTESPCDSSNKAKVMRDPESER